MRRPQKTGTLKLSSSSQLLISLSIAVALASSRLEGQFWKKKLEGVLLKILKTGKQSLLDAAIECLQNTDLDAYNALLETLEALSESGVFEWQGTKYDVLLIAAPVLAWTRFSIASGEMNSELQEAIEQHLRQDILADDTSVLLAPTLYAIDQLPYSHTDIFSITSGFAQALAKKTAFQLTDKQETVPFLADVRYLIAAVMAPIGTPLFRWQSIANPGNVTICKTDCLSTWQEQVTPLLGRMLPGCNLELILPDAFFRACRVADQQIRPASIRAAVHYLVHALDIEPDDLCAVIGGFGEESSGENIEEYRIGFALRTNSAILYGVVWPIYGVDEMQQTFLDDRPDYAVLLGKKKQPSQLTQILELLNELNVPCERKHEESFPMEFCDDCDAPLFADANGDLVHAEMPEDAKQDSHLH